MQIHKEETSFALIIKLNIHIFVYGLQTNSLLSISQLQLKFSIITRSIFLTNSIKITFKNANACNTITKAPRFKIKYNDKIIFYKLILKIIVVCVFTYKQQNALMK